jgi:hypothetical protein
MTPYMISQRDGIAKQHGYRPLELEDIVAVGDVWLYIDGQRANVIDAADTYVVGHRLSEYYSNRKIGWPFRKVSGPVKLPMNKFHSTPVPIP